MPDALVPPAPIVTDMKKSAVRRVLILIGRMDKLMILVQFFLIAVGVLFIFGAGQEVGGAFAGFWKRQLAWALAGSVCFASISLLDYRLLGRWAWALYLLGIVLLILVYPFGIVLNGARSWLPVPGLGATLQPAELAKPATLLFCAWLLSRPFARKTGLVSLVLVSLSMGIPVVLILLQPDSGTALVYIPCTAAMIFVAGLSWRWVMLGIMTVGLAVPVVYPHLRNHQKDRIKVFLEPPMEMAVAAAEPLLPEERAADLTRFKDQFLQRTSDVVNSDWNAHQSLLAVGSGGLWGKGFMKGTQHVLGFLPKTVAPTDFIFSVIAEEAGFVGATALVCAFIAIMLCFLRTAMLARDELGMYIAVGGAVIFFTHAFINIGMTIQAAPIIGIPLPFVSYGGSFMLGTMILAGLVQSVHIRRKRHPGDNH